MPAWSKLKAVAHTLPYDTILTLDNMAIKLAQVDGNRMIRLQTYTVAQEHRDRLLDLTAGFAAISSQMSFFTGITAAIAVIDPIMPRNH
ncbi:hypothetical protein [Cohnella silvisoli]|uniref:Uncharacterized protein n=1 Tax=Cohnella silvisoli TaxID=2873699 RepID=A0ABV1KXG5_9BACL|nr:hypothetical protein [Cohnella silvisoli]MCD9023579.1 hypothetical protein [Cohnella silvisoli]